MSSTLRQIALLIDADNVADLQSSQLAAALSQLAEFGYVSLRRAYGNWSKPTLASLAKILHEFAIVPVQQFDLTSGKNATDIALTIDAMDLVHGGKFDAFCVISCDSDFTPLVVRLRNEGIEVYGFGRKNKTAAAFREACTKFFDLGESKQSQSSSAQISQKTSQRSKTAQSPGTNQNSNKASTKTIDPVFRAAVELNRNSKGWANTKAVAGYLSQQNKRKKDYKAQTWAKYYQKFPDIFEVKPSTGKTLIRLR